MINGDGKLCGEKTKIGVSLGKQAAITPKETSTQYQSWGRVTVSIIRIQTLTEDNHCGDIIKGMKRDTHAV